MKKHLMIAAAATMIFLAGCSGNGANEPTGTIDKQGTLQDIQTDLNETLGLTEELGSSFDSLKGIFDDRGVKLGKSLSTNHGSRNCESGSITVTEQNGTKFVSVDKCQVKDVEADGDFSYKYSKSENNAGSIKSISFVLPDEAYIKTKDGKNKIYAKNVNFYIEGRRNYVTDSKSVDMNLSIENGGIKAGSKSIDVKNVEFSMKLADQVWSYELEGMLDINSKGWIAVATPEEFKQNNGEKCPYDGTLTISGKDHTLKFEVQSDQSIKVYYDNDIYKTYNSCKEAFGIRSHEGEGHNDDGDVER